MANPLMNESVWFNQQKFEQAEAQYQCILAGTSSPGEGDKGKHGGSSLVNEIAQARQEITKLLKNPVGAVNSPLRPSPGKMESLEKENRQLRQITDDLRAMVLKLDARVTSLEKGGSAPAAASAAAKPTPAKDDDDDDVDLFGSDESEDEEEEKRKAERVAAYKAKKATKPGVIAKSNIILDVKPWDDETDMKKMEEVVRSIKKDGLVWGASKLVPLAYGIKKLQIMCVVEDDKIGTDDLEEEITAFEDLVQSVDIAGFNKV